MRSWRITRVDKRAGGEERAGHRGRDVRETRVGGLGAQRKGKKKWHSHSFRCNRDSVFGREGYQTKA